MQHESVYLENNSLVILDQTKLPNEIEFLRLTQQSEIYRAIKNLQVRGAPAIGIAAAYGLYLAAMECECEDYAKFFEHVHAAKEYLNSSRPTAVNLSWALNRLEQVLIHNANLEISEIKNLLRLEAEQIKSEDANMCRKIGEFGLSLIKNGDGILTHCNAGELATAKYGTALAAIHLGRERGMNFRLYCDETRPLLQGARLTAFELMSDGIDTTLICDNMASQVMKNAWIDAVFVGADRIAANGDTCNKIGTSGLAILAKYYGIPFYVFAPKSTIDMNTKSGNEIIIEQRPASEITELWYEKRMAPNDVKVYNPAFDVTDHELISGIVTDLGILRAPYDVSLREIFA